MRRPAGPSFSAMFMPDMSLKRESGICGGLGSSGEYHADAVDAIAQADPVAHRLDMDVRSPADLDGFYQHAVAQFDDRSVVRRDVDGLVHRAIHRAVHRAVDRTRCTSDSLGATIFTAAGFPPSRNALICPLDASLGSIWTLSRN